MTYLSATTTWNDDHASSAARLDAMSPPAAHEAQGIIDTQQHIDRANRFFQVVFWVLFCFSLGLAFWTGDWAAALLVGLPTALIPTIVIALVPRAVATRLLVGAMLMVFCGLNIHQSHGLIEIHFGIFALLALLLCYEDWRVIVTAAGVIAVHHAGASYLQSMGVHVICMPKPSFSLVLLHAAYVVVETVALSFLAIMMHAKTVEAIRSQEAIQENLNSLHMMASETRVGMDAIAQASRNLTASSETIASGAQSQAASLEETAASLEEITAAVQQTAENAREASQLAAVSGSAAEEGGQVVAEAVTSMIEINLASSKIANIVSTINEIAFQTNLLAVNAAVEAARAGEEGRGFAVVASEVRSLSLRTTEASKEVRRLIADSLSKVSKGTELVNRSGETLKSIVSSVIRVRQIVTEIADAAAEQSSGIQQVNIAMTQMDHVTQNNSMQTDALASTAASLVVQTERLMEVVSRMDTVPTV
jgi:methyl-accepting chemotaxis protein